MARRAPATDADGLRGSRPHATLCPMRRLVLHIGTHKTGTTSIQKALARNRDVLAARGVLYPLDVLGSSRHDFNELATELRRDGEAGADLWRRTLAACRDGTAILSGEAMRRLGDDDVERIGQWTKDFDVRVLIYLRNVFDYLASAYKQRCSTRPLRRWHRGSC